MTPTVIGAKNCAASRQLIRDACFLARGMLATHVETGREPADSPRMLEAELLVDRALDAADRLTDAISEIEAERDEARARADRLQTVLREVVRLHDEQMRQVMNVLR